MREQKIRHAVLIQAEGLQPQPDLAHTLLRWQQEGIAISALSLATGQVPVSIRVSPPSYFRSIWYRLLQSFGLRSNELGGFGGLVPEASAG